MAKGKLNIYRDTFLEKEELDRLVSFINDNPALFLFVSSTQQFGIIQQSVVDPAFLVEVGTNANTVKITADSYALDSLGQMIYQRAFDNLPVPTDSNYYWMKISHRYDNYEVGFVDIAVDGTLSGAGTAFTEVLRGNSSGFPVKIKFFSQADDGTLTPATNSGVYEVVSVANANTATISGNLSAESNLRYVVLGAFSIKTSVAAITSTGMYSYDSCQIDFVLETVTDTAPTAGFIAGEGFYIARIYCDGASVTVQDKRGDYYFRLNFGDLALDDKAAVDASNLTAGNVTSWLAKLSVYTQAQITTALTGYLLKSQNLNDLANKATALTNLGLLKSKTVSIGDWDMTSVFILSVAHGLTLSSIRSVTAMIRDDDDTLWTMLGNADSTVNIIATNIVLAALDGGRYDSSSFDATSYNRGYIVIQYVP